MGEVGGYVNAISNYAASRANEGYKEKAAIHSMRRGRTAVRRTREEGAAVVGAQRVGLAAGGETGAGAANIEGEVARAVELKTIDITNAAKAEAWGLMEQGSLDRKAARGQLWGSFISAAAGATSFGMDVAKTSKGD